MGLTALRTFRPSVWTLAAATLLGWATPAARAAELYFNSYGWHSVYRLDTTTGGITHIPANNILNTTFLSSTDAGPDGNLYGVMSNALRRVSFATGQTVWSTGPTIADGAAEIAFAPDGNLYVANGSTLRRVSAATGATIPGTQVNITVGASAISLQGIDVAPNGTIYASDSTHIYTVNPATGATTLASTSTGLTPGGIFTDLDVGPDGLVRALGSFDYVWTYNPATGAGSWAQNKLLYNGESFSPSSMASGVVPEPATAGVAAAAAMALLAGRRRRRR